MAAKIDQILARSYFGETVKGDGSEVTPVLAMMQNFLAIDICLILILTRQKGLEYFGYNES